MKIRFTYVSCILLPCLGAFGMISSIPVRAGNECRENSCAIGEDATAMDLSLPFAPTSKARTRFSTSKRQAIPVRSPAPSISPALQVGQIYEGSVVKIKQYGAFVKFNGTKIGLIPISHLASRPIQDPIEVVNIGDRVNVKLLSFDRWGRINLSMHNVDQKTEKD